MSNCVPFFDVVQLDCGGLFVAGAGIVASIDRLPFVAQATIIAEQTEVMLDRELEM